MFLAKAIRNSDKKVWTAKFATEAEGDSWLSGFADVDYTKSNEDESVASAREEALAKESMKMQLGSTAILSYFNTLFITNGYGEAEMDAFFADTDLQKIKDFILFGAFDVAITKLNAYTPNAIITQAFKDAMVAKITEINSLYQ